MREVSFSVPGIPAPKGSPNVVVKDRRGHPLRRPRVLPDTPATETWQELVGWSAKQAMRGAKPFHEQALVLHVVFFLPRPAGRKHDPLPRWKPDGDKLLRATADPLHQIVFDEDSRIVDWHGYKRWGAAGWTGAWVKIVACDGIPPIPAFPPIVGGR